MKNHLPGLLALFVLWSVMTLFAARLSPQSPLWACTAAAFIAATLLCGPAAFCAGLVARLFMR
jgi:hypothetical protein